jgi:hypothetical protein
VQDRLGSDKSFAKKTIHILDNRIVTINNCKIFCLNFISEHMRRAKLLIIIMQDACAYVFFSSEKSKNYNKENKIFLNVY